MNARQGEPWTRGEEITGEVAELIADLVGPALFPGRMYCPRASSVRTEGPEAIIDLDDGRQLRIMVHLETPLGAGIRRIVEESRLTPAQLALGAALYLEES